MSVDISSLAYALKKACAKATFPLKHGHALQLVAATLGYGSLAAYEAAIRSGDELSQLDDAAHIVMYRELLLRRGGELQFGLPDEHLLNLILTVVKDQLPHVCLHRDEDSLVDAVREYVDDVAYNNANAASAMAMTNNDGVSEIYLPFDVALDSLPPPGETYAFEVDGHISMTPDTERVYCGHKIAVRGALLLGRIGRAVITKPVFDVERAELDYDWG